MKTFLRCFVERGEGIWAQSSGEYCQFQTLLSWCLPGRHSTHWNCTGSLLCSVVVLNAEFSLPWEIVLTTPCLVYNDSCCWSRREKIRLVFAYHNCGRLVWSVINDVNIWSKLKRKLMCAYTPVPPNEGCRRDTLIQFSLWVVSEGKTYRTQFIWEVFIVRGKGRRDEKVKVFKGALLNWSHCGQLTGLIISAQETWNDLFKDWHGNTFDRWLLYSPVGLQTSCVVSLYTGVREVLGHRWKAASGTTDLTYGAKLWGKNCTQWSRLA